MTHARLLDDLAGRTLAGRYHLVVRIAGGGVGEVYRAHDALLDRAVAVKVLQPALAADADLVTSFRAEARAAARLAHPNAVAVYDWGEDGGAYYMVMEYVDGTDLRDLLVSRGSLEPAQAADVVAAVCDALAAAHACGLVHRDVKPENVLLDRDGQVKVADFGIAAVARDAAGAPGAGLGAQRYIAPEQARGDDATPASDVWAAGALLSELLTGRPPLLGSGDDLLRRRASEPPPRPSDADPSIPRDLDDVVLTACALDPADRYADASDMAIALRRAGARSLPDAPSVASVLADVARPEAAPDMLPSRARRERRRRRPRSARRNRRRAMLRAARVIVTVVVTVALSVGGIAAAPAILGPREVDVPSLVGLDLARARREARAAGLRFEVAGELEHRDVPEGDVVAQEPVDGVVDAGSTVAVVVSDGPPTARVPELDGVALDDAGAALRRRGLTLGDVERVYADAPAGLVIAQSPARGRLEWGRDVDVTVSRGPRPVTVPDVAAAPGAEAERELAAAGLSVTVSHAYSDTVAAGTAVATTPVAGTVVAAGAGVELVVSLGPRYEAVSIPDVRGDDPAAARAELERRGLRVELERSCGETGGMVVETDPAAGATARENDLVTMFVC
ncbi:MAG TPA: PASTA domain-containing protein [Actinomycetota bacterium]|nr:PASTA domain-containing protein [Actinomycetota bacterium]